MKHGAAIRNRFFIAAILIAFIFPVLPSASAHAQSLSFPAQMNISFSPISIPAGGTSTLNIAIYNPNSFALNLSTNPPAWSDDLLPAELSFATPSNISTDCGGTVTAVGTTLSLLGGSVPGQVDSTPGSCSVSVDVTSTVAGNHVNTIPVNALKSTNPTGDINVTNTTEASATLRVNTVQPPSLSKTFVPNTIWVGQTSVLSINITNNDAAATLSSLSLTDPLPANIVIANPAIPAAWNKDCGAGASLQGSGGNPLATGDSSVTIRNASIAPGSTCTLKVNVTSVVPGVYTNTIPARAIQTQQAVTNANAASAPLNVQAIGLTKAFSPWNFQQGGSSTLTITLQNPSPAPYTGVSFQDNLPAGVSVTAAPASPQCGGTVSSTATSIRLDDGTIPAGSTAAPGTCSVSVIVTSSIPASYTNRIPAGSLVTDQGATNVLAATANVTVYANGLGLTAAKSFNPGSIAVGGTSTLTIDITAPADTGLTSLSISDALPAGVRVASPPSATKNANCVGPAFAPAAGDTLLTYSAVSIGKGLTCRLTVKVTSDTPGSFTNTISPANITNNENRNLAGNISATLSVGGLTVAKAFAPTSVNPDGLSLLTITLTNTNLQQLDNVTLTDTLPFNSASDGIYIAPSPNAGTTCNGASSAGLTAVPGTSAISMDGGTVPAQVGSVPGICTITVNVIGKGGALTYTNRIPVGAASGKIHGTATIVSNPAEATQNIKVGPIGVGIVKGFSPLTVFGGSSSTLTVELSNPNNVALAGIAFTDNLPQGTDGGMYIATPPNASTGTCGGSISAAAGATSFRFSGGSLAASASCSLTLDVTMNVNANLTNTIPAGAVTSTNGASNSQAASATLTNLPGASVSKSFGPNPIPAGAGNVSTLTITIQNTGNFQLDGMGLTDTLPNGLTFAAPPATAQCGGTVSSTSNSLTLADGVLAASSSCNITASITGPAAGSYTNCIPVDALTNNQQARNHSAACDTLTVITPPTIGKAFAPASIPAGANSVLTFTLRNPAANTVPMSGVAFTDTFPAGMTISSVPNPAQCGGLVTSTPNSISLVGGTIGVNSTCTVIVSVSAASGGSYPNTSDPITSSNGGTGNSATATLTVVTPPTISKSFAPKAIGVGGISTLTFILRNPIENTVALSGVSFSDTYPFGLINSTPLTASNSCGGTMTVAAGTGTISLTGASLAVNGSCSVSVQVTAANGGPHVNTSSAVTSTNGGPGNTASDTLDVTGGGLTLGKTTTSTGYQSAGQNIGYEYELTNTGSLTLYPPFQISDDKLGAAFECSSAASLAPLESVTCSAAYTVQGADMAAKAVTNHATATAMDAAIGGNVVTSNQDSVTVNLESLTLKKSTSSPSYRTIGTILNYSYTLTNTGGVTLYAPFEVSDDHINGGTAFTCGSAGSLTPGANVTCTNSYTVIAADLTAGSVVNVATATAEDAAGAAVSSNQSSVTIYAVIAPVISKAFSPNPVAVGTPSTLTFTISNPASNTVPLTGVGFTDNFPGGMLVAMAPDAAQCGGTVSTPSSSSVRLSGGTIIPGSSCTVTVSVIAGARGSYANTSGAVNSTNGGPGNTAKATLDVVAPPSISKAFSPTSILIGETSSIIFTLSNPNPAFTLTGVAFSDALPAGMQVAVAPNAATNGCDAASTPVFAPNASDTSFTFSAGSIAGGGTCTVRVDVTGTTSGIKSNTTSAVTSSEGGTGTTSNTATLSVDNPGLALVKSIKSGSPYDQAGDIVQYDYLLTNTGNVTLIGNGAAGVFTVTDDKASVSCPMTPTGLAAGASVTCTASYAITQADLDDGSVTNHARGHGLFGTNAVDSNEDSASAAGTQTPGLTLAKSIQSGNPYDGVTDILQYNYLLTNSGNVTLGGNGAGGVFTVTDDKATVTCPATPTSLAPGETVNCTASYAVTQADLDAGSVTNHARGHGLFETSAVDSNEDSATATGTQIPELTLEKSITLGDPYDEVGNVIDYAYLLTNSGNVTLTGNGTGGVFTVTDDKATVTCPATPTSLAPGETVACAASYAITQADLDVGSVTNHASGHALFGANAVDSAEDSANASGTQTPGLTLAKSITSGDPYDQAGDVIEYEYLLTNSGNVTLAGNGAGGVFTVTDDKVSVTCPAAPTSLAPGETVTCTASYTVVAADLGSEVTNHATGQSRFGSVPVASNEDSAHATGAPVLTVSKNDGQEIVAPGGTAEYVILVGNNSLQDATGIRLTDSLPRGTKFVSATDGGTFDSATDQVSWPVFDLAAGGSRAFRVKVQIEDSEELQQAEVFFIENSVHVQDDGTHSAGTPVEAEASDTDQIAVSSIKELTGTEQAGSNDPGVLIGEVLDYSISIELPPGTVNHLQAVDILDRGLAFVGCDASAPIEAGTLVLGKNPCTDASALTVQAEPTSDTDPNSIEAGRHISFDFGRVINSSSDPQTLVLHYRVIVLNIESNHDGLKGLNNQVKWSWEGGTLEGTASGVNIIEPELDLEKTVEPAIAAQGSIVKFSLKIEHTANSSAPAYEVLVSDPIPAGLELILNSVAVQGSAGLPTPKITANASLLSVYWSEFPLGAEATITFEARFIGPPPVKNTANAEWSSILVDPGTHMQPISPYNPHSTERRYDPADSTLNDYATSASATLTTPELPLTGFPAGQITKLPRQPESMKYEGLGDLWLEIPRLGVKVSIVGVPLSGEEWNLTWLGNQAGYLNGTAYPTHPGNSFITGHIYMPDGKPGPFIDLPTLRWGDRVNVHLGKQIYVYQVRSVRTVSPDDGSILTHEEYPWLTLITCKDYNPVSKDYAHRVAVRAVLLEIRDEASGD